MSQDDTGSVQSLDDVRASLENGNSTEQLKVIGEQIIEVADTMDMNSEGKARFATNAINEARALQQEGREPRAEIREEAKSRSDGEQLNKDQEVERDLAASMKGFEKMAELDRTDRGAMSIEQRAEHADKLNEVHLAAEITYAAALENIRNGNGLDAAAQFAEKHADTSPGIARQVARAAEQSRDVGGLDSPEQNSEAIQRAIEQPDSDRFRFELVAMDHYRNDPDKRKEHFDRSIELAERGIGTGYAELVVSGKVDSSLDGQEKGQLGVALEKYAERNDTMQAHIRHEVEGNQERSQEREMHKDAGPDR
ncbi:hypothetical protein [Alterisphingorhabdus coralli]|uniref:Uncharacterized protein n=1 Tax=Alterisphingorhabdus coralli TaxID=3071408 RepID=A0AA97F9Q9_9SPHN|nr:hypothetical protein [Parasphingorhabdus sp. SCSIO 66989]WOE76751.1 hypothetical protein RB602_15305 [Parasphingorhabdus sp. SCSIO 66989]